MDCLNNIIGLAPSLPLGFVLPPGMTLEQVITSTSGLYLSEAEGLNWSIINQGGNGFELLEKARRLAYLEVKANLIAGMLTRYGSIGEPLKFSIGQPSYRGTLFVEGDTVSMTIRTKYLPGVVINIQRLGILVNSAATIPVTLPTGEIVQITTQANLASYAEGTLKLPCDGSAYTFSYPTSEDYKPLSNIVNCGCNTKDNKYFTYVDGKKNEAANSFTLDAVIGCDYDELMCLNVNPQGYDGNTNNVLVMGYTVLYKAAYLLLSDLIALTDPNQVNAQDATIMESRRRMFEGKYRELLEWWTSSEGITIGRENCYSCPPVHGVRKNSVF